MELKVPLWLNTNFITEILAQHLNEPDIHVVELSFYPASAKGDHCMSLMIRVVADYEAPKRNGSISLIIKTLAEQEHRQKELLGESHIFQTEIEMYTKVLPLFEKILRECGDLTRFCASCIYHSLKPRQVMVFEDLSPQGFAIVRRFANFEELRAALTKLAKWHAVSFKLLQEQPELFKSLQYDITTVPGFLEQSFITKASDNFLDMLNNVESLKPYREYFEAIHRKGNLVQNWLANTQEYLKNRQENKYYVLCHGDFHLRNMMFRETEVMLLDFQMAHVAPMPNDLIYAKYVLFDAGMRGEKSDELFAEYFQTFSKTLEKIGYQRQLPSLVDFQRQMFERKDSDFLLIIAFMPLIKYFRNGGEEIVEDEQGLKELYYQKEYLDDLEDMFPRMMKLGYFETI